MSKNATTETAPKRAKVIPIKSQVEMLCESICKLLNETTYNGTAEIVITLDNCDYEVEYGESDSGDEDDDE